MIVEVVMIVKGNCGVEKWCCGDDGGGDGDGG